MRKSLDIALNRFLITLRSKSALATMFAMPLSFILIFGLLLGGGGSPGANPRAKVYPIAIIDEDSSLLSRLLVEAVEQEPTLRPRLIEGSELDRLIADTKIVGGLVIPPGFGEAARGEASEVELITVPGSNLEAGVRPILERLLQRVVGEYRLARQVAGSAEEQALRQAMAQIADQRERVGATVAAEPVASSLADRSGGYDALNHSTLGYTVMSVMMWILLMSGAILYERQQGTWGRLLLSPTRRFHLLLGYLLAFFVTGLFQFVALVAITQYLLGVEWGPWVPLLAVASAMILAAGGIGLFLAGVVRSYEQQQTLGVVVVIATSMLGGLFWPLDLLSPTMQRIGHLTPQAWAMAGLTEVALREASWSSLALPLAVLAAIGAIFALAGLLRLRSE